VITPRQTRLVRTAGLRAFQAAIAAAACDGPAAARRARAVIVPTRAAADELGRTIERVRPGGGPEPVAAPVLPDLVSRDDWYDLLHRRLATAPPRASEFEREVLFGRAARETAAAGAPPPFPLRPGLVVQMLGLYDELRRRHKTVEAFGRLLFSSLEPSADSDRGAARLVAQTRFMTGAFLAYERLMAASGRLDEHALRARLLDPSAGATLGHVIVTVPDQNADPAGLWPADFDLLARMPGLERVDVIATEEVLATGFLERLHNDLLPGIEEDRWTGAAEPPPVLLAPPGTRNVQGTFTQRTRNGHGADTEPGETSRRYWLVRDREEELVDAVRHIRASAPPGGEDRVAVVFQRPLPYVYLARHVFGAARMPYQAFDALPLAAEPYVSTIDLVLSAAASDFTRGDTIALLRSPHLALADDGAPLSAGETAALDCVLQHERHLGGADRLADLADRLERGASAAPAADVRRARRAARAAAAAARELAPLGPEAPPTTQLAVLAAFLDRHDRPPASDAAVRERELRARAAVRGAIDALARAHRGYDDAPVPFEDVAAALRRWIEGETFMPRTGDRGPHLVDAAAARYGDFDDVRLVGLVERDWPEASARNIFYPAWLLVQLGWPSEPDRLGGARAAFRDLLRLATSRLALSAFTLEDDALVRLSPFVEEIEDADLPVSVVDAPAARVFAHEALMDDPVAPGEMAGDAAAWLALRLARAPAGDPRFHGWTGPTDPGALRVSAVERYLDCPFRYFAAHVLRLGEERDEEPGLSALERGQLVHEVFERFFAEWQGQGRGAITASNLPEALRAFARVAEARLADLPEADRALERARLVGSAVASGFGARAFDFEVEADVEVVERLLEHPLAGEFVFATREGRRALELKGKADRVDLLADGTIRLVDYKLGRAPKTSRKIQLPVYGVCAEQDLAGRGGRAWRFGAAGYIAFGERQPFVPLAPRGKPFEEAVAAGVQRLVDSADGIAHGEFPVRPDEPYLCTYCPYPTVCRKDYVGDE